MAKWLNGSKYSKNLSKQFLKIKGNDTGAAIFYSLSELSTETALHVFKQLLILCNYYVYQGMFVKQAQPSLFMANAISQQC